MIGKEVSCYVQGSGEAKKAGQGQSGSVVKRNKETQHGKQIAEDLMGLADIGVPSPWWPPSSQLCDSAEYSAPRAGEGTLAVGLMGGSLAFAQ